MAIRNSMLQADGCSTTHCWQHSRKHKQPPAVWFAFIWLSSLRTLGAEIRIHTQTEKKPDKSCTVLEVYSPATVWLLGKVIKCILCLNIEGYTSKQSFSNARSWSFMISCFSLLLACLITRKNQKKQLWSSTSTTGLKDSCRIVLSTRNVCVFVVVRYPKARTTINGLHQNNCCPATANAQYLNPYFFLSVISVR